MKKIPASLLALVFLFSFTAPGDLPIGSEIPKGYVTMKDVSGNDVSLYNAIQGNGLLVIFSANTCPYVKWNDKSAEQACEYALEKEVGVVMINSNETERKGNESYGAMIKMARENRYNWYYVLDENAVIANAFNAQKTPECFLFNKDGKLMYHGAINDNPSYPDAVSRNHLKLALDEMISGKEVSVKVTKSIGCSIKRKEP